jgi:hypothetical protein
MITSAESRWFWWKTAAAPLGRWFMAADIHEYAPGGGHTQGCTAEYTEISVERSPPWVTLGFEAFGPMESLADSVRGTAARLAGRRPPAVGPGWRASYPEWPRQWDGAQSDRNPA